jgi:hypothetical protein
MHGKCPSCHGAMLHVTVADIGVFAKNAQWRGVSYQCPYCQTVLSVGVDPAALKSDLLDEILTTLQARSSMLSPT